MNLLVVTARPPWPPTMADAMTVDRLVRFLASRGHTVDLACFAASDAEDRELRRGLAGVCRAVHTVRLATWESYARTALTLPGRLPMQVQYYDSRVMRERIEGLVAQGDYDLVYTHLIRMAEYSRRLALHLIGA